MVIGTHGGGMDEEARAVEVEEASEECRAVIERIEEAVVVERSVLTAILAAIVARGHVLLEDVPGTGKTVTARVFAESLGLDFQRIQFTPDLLPSDVTGSNVYNEHDREFEFAEGPIFANVVLADEINRAPPKTQAALLEAMEERQVSVDGTTHELPTPFIVIATQNPVEQEGTFRLPEAQRDRFLIKTSIGYPDVEGEMGLLDKRANRETIAPSVEAAVDSGTVLGLQNLAENVTVEDRVRRYIVELSRYTRTDSRTEIGVSPRGVQRVFEATRAAAVIAGRDYVTPDDVKRIAVVAMAHRLVMTTEATVEGVRPVQVIHDALDAVDVPAVSPDAPEGSQGEGARSGPAEGPGSEPAQDDAGPSDDGTGSTGHQAGSETPTSAPRGQGTRSGGGGQSQSGGQPQGRQSQASGRAGQDGQGRQGGQGSRANQSGSGQQQTPQGQNQQGQNQQGRNRQGQRGQGQNRQRQSGHPQQRSQGQNQPPQGNQAPNQPAQSGQSGRQNYPSGQQPGQNPPPEEEKKVQDWSPPTDDEDDE